MIHFFRNLRLDLKIALLGIGIGLVTAIALVGLAVRQSGQYNTLAQHEVDALINADLDHITEGVYHLVNTENNAVQEQLSNSLKVARHMLNNAGDIGLADKNVRWTAVNQFTKEKIGIQIPRLTINGKWLGQNTDPETATPLVDEITALIGETATLFQRMNERGDMIRVATTVKDEKGRRAIGTFIPAVGPDGTPNPVVSAILRGKTYNGRAFVVNAWYLTAYEPIKDRAGRLIGMLYVGVKQKAVEMRIRQAILQTKVGKTGYVYVLGGKGEDRGHYIISQRGKRDGEDIWSITDSNGHYVIQMIIHKATALKSGEMTTVRYEWQNPGESEPRWKIARLVYFEPWDWVIGASVYEDELQSYRTVLSGGRIKMTTIMAAAGLMLMVVIGLAGIFFARTITRPIGQLTRAAEIIMKGNLDQAVEIRAQDEIGKLAHTFNTMTERLRQTMEGMRNSEEKYRSVIENIQDVIYRSDAEGRLVMASPSILNLLGYDSMDECLGKPIADDFYYNPAKRADFLKLLEERGSLADYEIVLKKKDGSPVVVEVNSHFYIDKEGNRAGVEGIFRDVTARKQEEEIRRKLEGQLTQSQKMEAIGTLAGGIAHDFNNILAGIIGYTELYKATVSDNPKAYHAMEQVLKAAERAKDLVRQILTFSRKTEHEKKPVMLAPIVKEVVKFMRASLPTTIEIKHIIDVTSDVVWADPVQIHQVLMNLCTNAWHAMKDGGGVLEIVLKDTGIDQQNRLYHKFLQTGRYLELSVRDTGHGIPQENIDKIFDPYFTTKSVGDGTGLGLAVVHGIVQEYGGEITVYSELGKGALFKIYLPLMEVQTKAGKETKEEILRGKGETILFVDDEKMVADMNKELLESLGYKVVEETNPVSAVETFRKNVKSFDLVITDKTMPQLTGYDVVREIRNLRPDIPVILCSGFQEREDTEKIKAMGINRLMIKPVNISVMARTIRNVLDKTDT